MPYFLICFPRKLFFFEFENSNSCRKFQFFYLINGIFAAETIQGRKLFEEIRYMRGVNARQAIKLDNLDIYSISMHYQE